MTRDIEGDYRRAYIEEYEAHKRAGNDAAAADVASILREHYAHEVEKPRAVKKATRERADVKAPENTAEPKPQRKA